MNPEIPSCNKEAKRVIPDGITLFGLSKNFQYASVSGIIKETGVF